MASVSNQLTYTITAVFLLDSVFQTSNSKALPFPFCGFDANVLLNKDADTLPPSQAESDFILQSNGMAFILVGQILRPCVFS